MDWCGLADARLYSSPHPKNASVSIQQRNKWNRGACGCNILASAHLFPAVSASDAAIPAGGLADWIALRVPYL